MSMNVGTEGGSGDDVMVEMNMTPLIDVMLVLIIMLIITIPIQNHSVNLNLPVGNPPPPITQPEVVQIDIDFDGTMMWNGVVVPSEAALEAKLAQVAAEPVQAEIHLRPNKLVPYKDVAAVMASAQRVGATKIGLIGNEQYMQ